MGMYVRALEKQAMRAYTRGYVQGWMDRKKVDPYPVTRKHREWCEDKTCPR